VDRSDDKNNTLPLHTAFLQEKNLLLLASFFFLPPLAPIIPLQLSGTGCHRLIPPLNIREEIITGDRPNSVTYRVGNPGWLRAYPVANDSHRGEVTFSPNDDGSTTIAWNVRWVALRGGGEKWWTLTT